MAYRNHTAPPTTNVGRSNSAQGFIKSVTEKKFIAAFAIDNRSYSVTGNFSINVPKFASKEAIVEYELTEHFTSHSVQTFKGKVNKANLELMFGDELVIRAEHATGLTVGNDLSGTAKWTVD